MEAIAAGIIFVCVVCMIITAFHSEYVRKSRRALWSKSQERHSETWRFVAHDLMIHAARVRRNPPDVDPLVESYEATLTLAVLLKQRILDEKVDQSDHNE